MKIHLTIEQPAKPGYVWGCPNNTELKNAQEFFKCWEYCMEAQATEIYAPTIMDIFQTSEIEEIIPQWAKLIRPGGKILLGGTDMYILARTALSRIYDLGTLNDVLFKKPYAVQSITSAESTASFLKTVGFSIKDINIDQQSLLYTVEAVKNGSL